MYQLGENYLLDSEIKELQSQAFCNVATYDDITRVLAKWDEDYWREAYESYERLNNNYGSLRDVVTLLSQQNKEVNGLLYIIAAKYEQYLKDPELLRYGQRAPFQYVLWATENLLPTDVVKRVLYRIDILNENTNAEKKYLSEIDTASRLKSYITDLRKRPERVLKLRVDALAHFINDGNGILPGEVLHLVGGPGGGKTTFLLDMLMDYVDAGGEALFFSLDMTPNEIEVRLFQRIMQLHKSGVLAAMKAGTIEAQEAQDKRLTRYKGLKIIGGGNIALYGITLSDIGRKIALSSAQVVAIDYVTVGTIKGFSSEREQARAIAENARIWAQEFGITVVLLSQTSREAQRDKAKGGIGGHGMGGATLEQKVNYEIEFTDDAPLEGETNKRIIATIIKNRDGGGQWRSFQLDLRLPNVEFERTSAEVETPRAKKPLFVKKDFSSTFSALAYKY